MVALIQNHFLLLLFVGVVQQLLHLKIMIVVFKVLYLMMNVRDIVVFKEILNKEYFHFKKYWTLSKYLFVDPYDISLFLKSSKLFDLLFLNQLKSLGKDTV